MISQKEQFKLGFISACIDMGLSVDEATELIKQASLATSGIKTSLSTLLALGMLLPIFAGSVAGFNYAITPVSYSDPKFVADKELETEYRRLAELAKVKKRRKDDEDA